MKGGCFESEEGGGLKGTLKMKRICRADCNCIRAEAAVFTHRSKQLKTAFELQSLLPLARTFVLGTVYCLDLFLVYLRTQRKENTFSMTFYQRGGFCSFLTLNAKRKEPMLVFW